MESSSLSPTSAGSGQPRRYVLVGTGTRGLEMFARPLMKDHAQSVELAALFDVNPLRIRAANHLLGSSLPEYTDFDRMLEETRCDGVIVASRDDTHAEYVIRALRAGRRVYAEKPLCVSVQQCRDILDEAGQAAGECFVTHNARYNAARSKIKELVEAGKIGEIQHIEFRLNLNRKHGGDYFRRWHKHKRNSGGLLIHKATHHFDFINWLAGGRVERLRASGGTYFYGAAGPFHGLRCRGCEHASHCDFYHDLEADPYKRELYLKTESQDGYHWDACVFDPTIDAEDYALVQYVYDNGIRVSYSLSAYSSYEGTAISVQGTKGRLEHESVATALVPEADEAWLPVVGADFGRLTLFDQAGGKLETVPLPKPDRDGHGGSDRKLRQDFFERDWHLPRPPAMASLDEAVQAVLVGAAANLSIAQAGASIDVQKLLDGGCAS